MKHKTKQKLKLNHKAGLNCEAGLLLYPDSPRLWQRWRLKS